ncbi:MAG: hypothetical protein KGZ74_14115 [Chitinophagaceae bacterium]|nr:hypothetical protein [Chitinophagaceae bacterium]
MKKKLFYLCCILSTSIFSQLPALNKGERLYEDHIITAVDSNEIYVWIGTDHGLFRFNRKRNRKKFYSLSNTGHITNYVTDLYCMKDGCVWIATNNGLLKYDNYTFIPFTIENSDLPENSIISVTVNMNNYLLVGTVHRGTMQMQKNRFYPEIVIDNIARSKQKSLQSRNKPQLGNTGQE